MPKPRPILSEQTTDDLDTEVDSEGPTKPAEDHFSDIEADEAFETDSTFKSHFFRPAVICGICEACGSTRYVGGKTVQTTDKQSGQPQYNHVGGHWQVIDATQCPHYKKLYEHGSAIRCSGCGERFTGARNGLGKHSEILATRQVLVFSFTDQPKKLIMYCDHMECAKKRFNRLKNG